MFCSGRVCVPNKHLATLYSLSIMHYELYVVHSYDVCVFIQHAQAPEALGLQRLALWQKEGLARSKRNQ